MGIRFLYKENPALVNCTPKVRLLEVQFIRRWFLVRRGKVYGCFKSAVRLFYCAVWLFILVVERAFIAPVAVAVVVVTVIVAVAVIASFAMVAAITRAPAAVQSAEAAARAAEHIFQCILFLFFAHAGPFCSGFGFAFFNSLAFFCRQFA